MTINWTRAVIEDLAGILQKVAERDPLIAENIVRRVRNAEQTIDIFPRGARQNPETGHYECHVPRTRVILIYRLDDGGATIVAAFHTSHRSDSKPAPD